MRWYDMNRRDLKCRELKLGFAERDKCKPVLMSLSLAGNLKKTLILLYGTKRRELWERAWLWTPTTTPVYKFCTECVPFALVTLT
jgi:hypothetical protein